MVEALVQSPRHSERVELKVRRLSTNGLSQCLK
nr:MAG TPA: hypothetical protein [Caudoviricetes sp.]